MAYTLVIGNKNYSSWSMRPWVLMRQLGIDFTERKLRFDFSPGSAFRQAVAQVSPAGQVPVLLDHDTPHEGGAAPDSGHAVWDTLAIIEHLADAHPQAGVWPADRLQRSRARSLAAEMHAGFGPLRSHCPMNIEAALPEVGQRVWTAQPAVRANVARIGAMWADALQASGGPFLFGAFCAADAMYAPVVMRLATYGLPVPDDAAAYMARVQAAPGVATWVADARAEQDFLDFEEPYRTQR